MGDAGSDSQMEKIRRLLAKAESTPYPEEAEAFLLKVAELAKRFRFSDADIWASAASADRDDPIHRIFPIPAPYAARKANLVGAVAESQGCKAVRYGSATDMSCALIGFEGDVRRCETLITSLFIQLTNAMVSESPTGGRPGQTAAWRRSFITAYSMRISDRLAEANGPSESPDASDSTAVALRDRSVEVHKAMDSLYPSVRPGYTNYGSSPAGRRAGERAADRSDLGGERLGGDQSRSSLKSES